jgi:hypothetical protein
MNMFNKMKLPNSIRVPKMSVPATLASLLDKQPVIDSSQSYLLGLRGLLAIECFVWVFLQTFVPTVVEDSHQPSPLYQVILRKTAAVLFWNDSLLYSFFIFLSARTICIPFFKNPTKNSVASALFRRGIRLWFPVAVALAIVKCTFSQTGFQYLWNFKNDTNNTILQVPFDIPGTLAYFNSVFNLFWTSQSGEFAKQAGSKAFPSQTLWILNAIYSQSYTVYMTMIIIPYTRARWRVQAFVIFIAMAWWVQSWAWYGNLLSLLSLHSTPNADSENFQVLYNRPPPRRRSHAHGIQEESPPWDPYLQIHPLSVVDPPRVSSPRRSRNAISLDGVAAPVRQRRIARPYRFVLHRWPE